jgi:OOP family OmpA-OmpF porin
MCRSAFPLKVWLSRLPGDVNRSNFVSMDGVLQFQYFRPEKKWTPYALAGVGFTVENGDSTAAQFPVGLGVNFHLGNQSFVNVQAEYRVSLEEDRDNIQFGLGYVFKLGQKTTVYDPTKSDKDKDGVMDADDECPELFGMPTLAGCPDADGDGVADKEDKCPEEAGTPENKGCPQASDTDGDGVPDTADECPEVAGEADLGGCPDTDQDGIADQKDDCPDDPGLEAFNGCPDTDGDGIQDADDQCPEVAGVASANGCPDADGDGFADDQDLCPEVAGTTEGCPDTDEDGLHDGVDNCPESAGPASNNGCPEIEQEAKDYLEIAAQAIQFETGKAELKPSSYDVLNKVADILEQYPDYQVRIVGHTDSVGDEVNNQKLSLDRASECYKYLVFARKIPQARITYEGKGEAEPIASNDTKEGREQNRRVDFELYLK